MYGGHLWSKYSPGGMNKLNVAFNDIYRKLFKIKRGTSMSCIYVHNNIDGLKAVLKEGLLSLPTAII